MIISGVGRLGRDAELRYIPSGTAVANLALAFNFGQKQQDGNRLPQWVDCSPWGKQAEVLVQYLKKGNQVSITADAPHIEVFTRGDSTQGSKLVANIINIELISGQGNGQQKPASNPSSNSQPAPRDNMSDAPYDDDIPF
jgi:single-strand DNA-binding protein